MSRFFLVLVSFSALVDLKRTREVRAEDEYNVTQYDYCRMKCIAFFNKRRHIACECHKGYPEHDEPVEDWYLFRELITSVHNQLRNLIAAGGYFNHLPNASNMLIMNYDLELEFIARCFGRHYYLMTTNRDTNCLLTHDNVQIKMTEFRNVEFHDLMDWLSLDHVKFTPKHHLDRFRDKLRYVSKDMVASYDPQRDKSFNQLLPVLRWSMNRLGCTRIKNPDISSNFLILCFYRGEDDGKYVKGEPLYSEGTPCSDCPERFPCDKVSRSSDALCGEFRGTPNETINLVPFASHRTSGKSVVTEGGFAGPKSSSEPKIGPKNTITSIIFGITIFLKIK